MHTMEGTRSRYKDLGEVYRYEKAGWRSGSVLGS